MTLLSAFRKQLMIGGSALAFATATIFSPLAQAAEDTVTWRVQSHWPGSSSSYKDSLERIKRVIEERTEGRLELELYEAGQLFKAQETFNAVSRGVIQMGTISPAYAQNQMTLAGIAFGLPFAFQEEWEAAYFHKNMGFEEMLREEAAEHNIYYSTDRVFPTELVLKKPIESMDDFRSLKIRSAGALQKFFSEAGAAGTYVPGGEIYQALSSGVVDGAHWGAAQGAASMGLYEVAKYHVQPPLSIAGTDAFIVSQKALDKLSEEDQKTVKQALDEQFWVRTSEYLYKEKVMLAKVQAEQGVKINTLPKEVQSALRATAKKMWDEEAERSDKAKEAVEMVKTFLSDLGYE